MNGTTDTLSAQFAEVDAQQVGLNKHQNQADLTTNAELSAGGIRKIYLGENAPKAPNPYEYHNNEPLAADWEEYPEEPSEDLEVYDEPLYENFAEYDDEAVSGEQEDLYEAPVYEDPEEFYHDSDELDPDVLEAAYYNHEEELYRGVVGDYGDSEDELLIQIQTLSVQEYDEEF